MTTDTTNSLPTVPDNLIDLIQTYGDSRADEDGLQGLRVSELILAMRRWAGELVDSKRSRDMVSSSSVKVKTADLTDLALDWAVAKCEGHHWRVGDRYPQYAPGGTSCWMTWRVSSDWAQAGPIIEREHMAISWVPSSYANTAGCWSATIPQKYNKLFYANTPLIAAMRCFCCSKLGDEIEIPKELT